MKRLTEIQKINKKIKEKTEELNVFLKYSDKRRIGFFRERIKEFGKLEVASYLAKQNHVQLQEKWEEDDELI